METIINIKDLHVHYDKHCALYDVNMNILENDFLAIVGPNGGGKSTLLKSILGLIPITNGEILIDGKSPKEAHGIIGYVPQFSKFDKSFPISVEEVILSSTLANKSHLFHKHSKLDKILVSEILERLNITDLGKRQIGELSGGQLQKVLIARALALNPKILILDEPTASLDSKASEDIYSILKDLNKDKTIVLVTHDIGNIQNNSSTLACINKSLKYYGKAELNNTVSEELYGTSIKNLISLKERNIRRQC